MTALANEATSTMLDFARNSPLFLDGQFVAGAGEAFDVVNPATEEVLVSITGASVEQTSAMIAAADRAAGPWGAMKANDRIANLREYVAALRRHADEVREVLIDEAGCPAGPAPMPAGILYFQVQTPLRHAEEILDLYASLPEVVDNPVPLKDRVTPFGKLGQSLTRYTPIGVVAGIAAYNYPLFTAVWKVMPALAAGNAVILRPSPLTPVSALIFAKAAVEAKLPPGVLSVLIEPGIAGAELLTTDPRVGMISFTGSTQVGQQVMRQAASTMKRLQLELGGKSAQIFLPDAVDQAIGAAAGVCLAHAGQGCVLGTRIFVPEDRKAEVLEGMKASLADIPVGDTRDPATVLGPVITKAQVERCEHFVKLAVAAGAKVVAGGRRPPGAARGYFYEPTILDVPDNDSPAAREEIFGPVVVVIGYRDLNHAVAMANESSYGLSGYVFGRDQAVCLDIAMRLHTGAVNVNGSLLSSWASGGGHKMSGIGRERGEEGIRLYQNVTCLSLCG